MLLLTSFRGSVKATQKKLMYSTFHCTKEVPWTSLYSTGRRGYFDGEGKSVLRVPSGETQYVC